MSEQQDADAADILDRSLNSFATQSFRDQADRDYISARLACRYELFPQFLWSSHQAVEKYLKAILLYNRIPAKKVRHDIKAALELTKSIPLEIKLSTRSRKFIDHLASHGEFRYVDIPYHAEGQMLIDLDLSVWEIRRYCQVLNVFGKKLPAEEEELLEAAIQELESSTKHPRHKFKLHNGLLERILSDKNHPSRPALIWQNATYSTRNRKSVCIGCNFHAQNPRLYLYPEMLDEVMKLVFIPERIASAYRAHLAEIQSNPDNRP